MSVLIKYTELWNSTDRSISAAMTDQPYTVLFDDREYVCEPQEAINHAGVAYTWLGAWCDAGKWTGDAPFSLCWPTTAGTVTGIECWCRDGKEHAVQLLTKDGTMTAMEVAENVSYAAGDAPTAEEFKDLIDALISAGIMAEPET